MIVEIFNRIPAIAIALIGMIITAVFILSIPYGINFNISVIYVLISIPFYVLVLSSVKRTFYKVILGLLVFASFITTFQELDSDSFEFVQHWSDYNEIIKSPIKLFISNVFYSLAALSAPMTFIGIVNK